MLWQRLMSWKLILALLLPIVVSCQDNGDPLLTKELKSLSRDNKLSVEARGRALAILNLHANVLVSLRQDPRLKALPGEDSRISLAKAKALHAVNEAETIRVLDAQDKSLRQLADNVKSVSKVKFDRGLSRAQVAEHETLVVMNLLVLRDLSQVAARRILMLMTKFDKPYFDEIPENTVMKQRLLADYTAALAITAVSANDLRQTLSQLNEMRTAGLVGESLENALNKVVGQYGGAEKAKRAEVGQFLDESLTGKAQDSMSKAMRDYHQALQGKSFLFDPAQADHPLIHILVIVSNLSWGLVNTLVGLGFVITAAIVAPITMVAGATVRAFGYEPLFYEMRMPKLAIAESNMQIYADVCGLGIVPGKMSAGLFELDFCAGQSFASDHEAGHAKQSAILGPLYFPAAILSYILNMGHGGYIEDWADAWAVV